jgi:hypothetical protein
MRVAGAKWSPIEVAALRHTKNATEPTDKYFWFEVASKVSQDCGTHRTAHACVEKYHQLCTKSSGCAERKPPTPKREKNKSKPKALSFSLEDLNFGTNKRKRVLRSMVKKVQENYVDDYFADSGPPEDDLMQSFNFSDDDGFEIEGPVVELESPPSSAPSSPEILRHVDRDEIDGYITQITKKIARGRRSRRSDNKHSEGEDLAPKKQRASEEESTDGAKDKTEEEELPLLWALDKSLELDSQDDEEVSLSEDENDL